MHLARIEQWISILFIMYNWKLIIIINLNMHCLKKKIQKFFI